MYTDLRSYPLVPNALYHRYDWVKHTLLSHPVPFINYQFHDNLLCHTAASCAAGMIATSEQSSRLLSYRLSSPHRA